MCTSASAAATLGRATTSLEVDHDNVILDNIWGVACPTMAQTRQR